MKAEIVQVTCQHSQEYGPRYAALAIILEDESKLLLRLPMWQYDPLRSQVVLQRIANAVNEHCENAVETHSGGKK
jgi:hypothetical protein